MNNLKYFFIEVIPYGNFDVTIYDTLEELEETVPYYMHNNNNWYIVKGEILKCEGDIFGKYNN